MENSTVRFTPEWWAQYRQQLAHLTGAPVPEDDATPSQWYSWFVSKFFEIYRNRMGREVADPHCAAVCRGSRFAEQLEPYAVFHLEQSSADGQTFH
jgi:hypothetical protein